MIRWNKLIPPEAFAAMLSKAEKGINALIPKAWGPPPRHRIQILNEVKGRHPNSYSTGNPALGVEPKIEAVLPRAENGTPVRYDDMLDAMEERIGPLYGKDPQAAADFEYGHERAHHLFDVQPPDSQAVPDIQEIAASFIAKHGDVMNDKTPWPRRMLEWDDAPTWEAYNEISDRVSRDVNPEELSADLLGTILANRKMEMADPANPMLFDAPDLRQLAITNVLGRRLPYIEKLKLEAKTLQPLREPARDRRWQRRLPGTGYEMLGPWKLKE